MSWASPFRKAAASLAIVTAATVATPTAARADVVFVLSGADFSGGTDNVGGNITVTIANIVGGVSIAIANNLVGATAFLDALYLNTSVAPLAAPAGSCVNCAALNGALPTFSFGSNAFQADGDGLYDILIELPQAPPANRLTSGESITVQILSSTVGFNEASFNSLSAPGGGAGPFVTAAHIQSVGPNLGSDWITTTVPEPGSMILVGTGLFGLAARLRHQRKHAG
jgi:hypothetical protein